MKANIFLGVELLRAYGVLLFTGFQIFHSNWQIEVNLSKLCEFSVQVVTLRAHKDNEMEVVNRVLQCNTCFFFWV